MKQKIKEMSKKAASPRIVVIVLLVAVLVAVSIIFATN